MLSERRKLVLSAFLATAALGLPASNFAFASQSPQIAAAIACCDKRTPISSLPFLITAPGSYYLTRGLVGTSTYGIGIQADDVTLDLNGFTLRGSGGGDGILVFDPHKNVTIVNGIVRGWTGTGISAGNVTTGRFQGLLSEGNGGSGIVAGINCTVLDCSASSNGLAGIQARAGSTIVNCTARSNMVGFANLIPAHGMVIQNCTASANTDDGIVLFSTSGCAVIGNDCQGNADRGILIDSCNSIRIDSNTCAANAVGLEVSGGSNSVVIRNMSRGNSSNNYSIDAGQDAGPIGTAAGSASPWANL